MYLEFHRGTLTAQSRNKKYNRKSEYLYQDAESLGVIAELLASKEYPSDKLLAGWKLILLNQFHDIIPGSSIAAVYEDSKEQYEIVAKEGSEMVNESESAVASLINADGRIIVVFNTLGFVRSSVVIADTPEKREFHIEDMDGNVMPSQITYDGKLAFFAADVPAKGYKTFRIVDSAVESADSVKSGNNEFSNDYYTVKFDGNMNIASYYDKSADR